VSTITADEVALESPPVPFASRVQLLRFLAALIILVSGGLRIAYLTWPGALDLVQDESHYWDWSRHPDWSYYSKGPLVAYLIGGSCYLTESWSQAMTGNAMLSVRLPAVLCGGLLLCSLYVLTTLVYRREVLALCVVALAAVMPPVAAASLMMTIDAPYICCWSWALVFGYLALFRERRWAWPAAGLMIALGLLAKQTMVLWVPSLMLFLYFTPGWRRHLCRPGFWVMAFVGALGSVPILVWNYQNDWVTLKHLLGHTGAKQPIHLLGPFNYIAMQFVTLLGYWFAVWCAGMWIYRPWRSASSAAGRSEDSPNCDELRYLWWMSAPTFFFFMAFSLKNGGGELNWPVTAYLSGLVLAGGWVAQRIMDPRPRRRREARIGLTLIVGLGFGLTLLMHDFSLIYPLLSRISGSPTTENIVPMRRLDPTSRLRGWRTLAAEVDRIRDELKQEGVEPVIAADRWTMPGAIGFYCQGHPTVYSFGPVFGDRHSQYDLWHPNPLADPEAFRGRTFILVVESVEPLWESFEQIGELKMVMHYQRGEPISRWLVTVARGYRGTTKKMSSGNF